MPHVKIAGTAPLAQLFGRLTVFEARDETGLRKISAYYLDQAAQQILAEAVVIEGGLPKNFFLQIKEREGMLVVRLLAATDPEKTPAVKRLVAQLGLRVAACAPGARVAGGNLEREIGELGSG